MIRRRRDIPNPPRYCVPFPDLSVEQRTAPCSNRIVPGVGAKRSAQTAILPDFVVATTHKQGPAVHHRRELPYLGGRKI